MEIKKETCKQRWSRKSKNALTRSIGFCKVSDVVAQIKMKEAKVKARKNQFGLQYMDLFEQGSSEEVLDRCIALARQDIDPLQAEIKSLKDKIAQIEAQTKGNLVQKNKYGIPSVTVTPVETTPPDYPSFRAATGLTAEDNIAFATPYYPSAPPHEEL